MNLIEKVVIKDGVNADTTVTINQYTGQVAEINAKITHPYIPNTRGIAGYSIVGGKPTFSFSTVGANEMWVYVDGIAIKCGGITTVGIPSIDGRELVNRTADFIDIDKSDYNSTFDIDIYITGSAQKIITADATLELKRKLTIINQTNVSGLGILPQVNLPSGHTFLKGGVRFKTVPLDTSLTVVRVGTSTWIYY